MQLHSILMKTIINFLTLIYSKVQNRWKLKHKILNMRYFAVEYYTIHFKKGALPNNQFSVFVSEVFKHF